MFLALGVGAYSAAIFLVITHAFFKGTLFLGAGSVIHGNGDNQDMRIMGRLPQVHAAHRDRRSSSRWLAIAGVPPFSGFWAKDEILAEGVPAPTTTACGSSASLAAVLTGVYMTRQVRLVFFGNERWQATDAVGGRATPNAEHTDDDGAHDVTIDPATPTVGYGEPPRTPALHHDPHECHGSW